MGSTSTSKSSCHSHYCFLSNIPNTWRSSDLRNFFAVFIEANKFDLFHFRHRPQTVNVSLEKAKAVTTTSPSTSVPSGNGEPSMGAETLLPPAPTTSPQNINKPVISVKKFCCPIRFSGEKTLNDFIRKYNRKCWMEKTGRELPSRVLISKVDLTPEDLEKFSTKEFRPPPLMPRGNIGTPNKHFLDLIKVCKLPPSLITKLGLDFPRGRVFKKYSNVPYDYGTRRGSNFVEATEEEELDEEDEVTDAQGRYLSSIYRPKTTGDKKNDDKSESDTESNADEDEDRCEEWERHEALHEHRTSHGTMFDDDKERLYEEKIELKWEKGGSGLVFYTDAQFWESQEEDHDDWDVDMEGYYVPGGGDKDARDFLEMRKSERFQQGLEETSVFKPRPKVKLPRPRSPPGPSTSTSKNCDKIGAFEKYTRGIGRKILEERGWKDGQGLGSTIIGISDAIESDGQPPMDRRGFGYFGEKIEFTSKASRNKRKHFKEYFLDPDVPEKVIIGTIYDKPTELDINEPLLRRNAPTFVKRYEFVKGTDRMH